MEIKERIANIILDMDAYDGKKGHASAMIASIEILAEFDNIVKENEELRRALNPTEYYGVLGSSYKKFLDWKRNEII